MRKAVSKEEMALLKEAGCGGTGISPIAHVGCMARISAFRAQRFRTERARKSEDRRVPGDPDGALKLCRASRLWQRVGANDAAMTVVVHDNAADLRRTPADGASAGVSQAPIPPNT
jgi:hypothetical protein